MVPCTLTVRRLLPPSTAGGATEALIAPSSDLARENIGGGGLGGKRGKDGQRGEGNRQDGKPEGTHEKARGHGDLAGKKVEKITPLFIA